MKRRQPRKKPIRTRTDRPRPSRIFCDILVGCLVWFPCATLFAAEPNEPVEIKVTSRIDGTAQPSMLLAPEAASSRPTPLLVFLHSWSADYRQNLGRWQQEAVERGWIYLRPNFRGPNSNPQACGSRLARQDILDAIDYVVAHYQVDKSRIYLAGVSGGGHMTMLMVGYYPRRFSAASAWVGISDLAEWYRFHLKADGTPQGYARMVSASCGGAPGTSAKIDAEYKSRSPIYHLSNVGDLPLDLNAGVQDGHTGSVPVAHSLKAFNVIAQAGGHAEVSAAEMQELWDQQHLSQPLPGDREQDPLYGRALRLRRAAGQTRVTIFDGGHEGIARAAMAWLSQHQRATEAKRNNSPGPVNRKEAAETGESTKKP